MQYGILILALAWFSSAVSLFTFWGNHHRIHHDPLVIAHRGASGYLPEHTLPAATLAYAQGADFIEQDVVLSKDNFPVVLHDIHIDTTTDVAQQFPNRQREDGRYYAIDFTLAELKQLRVHERKTVNGNQAFANRYQGKAAFRIATLEEHLELIQQLNRQFNRTVGWYVEIKAPAWHKAEGYDISAVTLEMLRRFNLDSPNAPLFVQCFDFSETQRLRTELKLKARLIQLIAENSWGESTTDYDYLRTQAGLHAIAKVADGIGPWIPQLLTRGANNQLHSTGLAEAAHELSLHVHPYTFRSDDVVLNTPVETLLDALLIDLKVEGIFTDFTDHLSAHINLHRRESTL